MSYNLVAVSGKIKTGKDTIIQMIQEESNQDWILKHFADKLKLSIALLYGCSRENLESQSFKENMYYHFDSGEIKSIEELRHSSRGIDGNCICPSVEALQSAMIDFKPTRNNFWASFRTILQYEGTQIGRDMRSSNFWINSLFADYKENLYNTVNGLLTGSPSIPRLPNWIISSLRFENEAEAVRSRNGLLIRVERPGMDLGTNYTHESETSLDNYPYFNEIIINDGTLEDLRNKVKEIVKKYNL